MGISGNAQVLERSSCPFAIFALGFANDSDDPKGLLSDVVSVVSPMKHKSRLQRRVEAINDTFAMYPISLLHRSGRGVD